MTVEYEVEYINAELGSWVAREWWLNFWTSPGWVDVGQELVKYNARLIVRTPGSDLLAFDSEEDAALFMLRWS